MLPLALAILTSMDSTSRWLDDREQALWRELLAAKAKITRLIDEALQRGQGLTSPEFAVLVTLSETEGGKLRMRDICQSLEWDRSRASHQVTRMQRRGLVSKYQSRGDARGVEVRLTAEGRERLVRAAPEHVESVRRLVFDHLDEETAAALHKFCSAVIRSDDARG